MRKPTKAVLEEFNNATLRTSDIPLLPKNNFVKFNEIIGNPIHPETLKRCPLLPHQIDYHDRWNKIHRLLFNKARKIGATDGGLRNICENCYGSYMGHNVMIVSGNRQKQANKFLDRFDALFWDGWTDLNNRKWKYGDLVMEKGANKMKLYSNVVIETFPAEPTALRGPENVKCVFMSEAAHINRVNDTKVYTALHPIAANDDTMDFILESTPNGKRGFFHNLCNDFKLRKEDGKKQEYNYMEYDYHCALGKLSSEAFIEAERINPEIDFEQEYMCRFTTSGSSAFKEEEVLYTESDIDRFEDLD